MILFLNVNLTGELKEKASLEELSQRGLPVKSMENAGISKEDMEKYLVFWEDLKCFPVVPSSPYPVSPKNPKISPAFT